MAEIYDPREPPIPSGDVPDFPVNIVAVAGATTALVSWDPPASDGGSEITGYTVISTPDNKIQTVGADVFSVTMTGLKNGTAYTFQVFAINEIGMSGISSAVTPYLPPVVSKLTAVITNNTVTLRWTAVAGALASPITSYTLTCSDSSVEIPEITPLTSLSVTSNMTCVLTNGLTFGTPISFSLYASSAILSSATITLANVIPLQFPDSPSNFIAVARAASAFLTWTAPDSNGGTPITGYVITYDGVTPDQVAIPLATLNATASSLSILVSRLVNGNTYTFYIRAKTKLGLSETPVTSLQITPYPLPGKPVLTLTPGNTEVTLSWTATAGAPESPITNYLVTCTNPDVTIPNFIPTSPITISGLTNGTAYTFRINSVSDIGSSAIVSKIATPSTVPTSPLNLTAVARAASAVLSWLAPTSNGGMPITAYIITTTPTTITTTVTGKILPTTATISRLTNGTPYTFNIVARNSTGLSESTTTSESITPYALPGAPVLTITPSDSRAVLSWTAIAAPGSPITGYVVTCTDTTVTIPSSITSSPLTITGLTNGTVYTFRINSVSAIGSSAVITKTVLVANVPESPTNLVATARAASAVLSWTAPTSNGGAPITSYIITTTPTTTTTTVTGAILPTTATISKLINGTPYTFNIVARNATGLSESTTTSESITPYALPGAPVLTITPSDSRAVLSWTAIAAPGSPITGYVVTCTDTTVTIPSSITSTTLSIAGLTNGTVYTFRINSVSAIGSSAVVSKTVLVASAPDSPTNFQAISRPASVTLSWTPPSSNGGAPINAYVISSVPTTTTTILATATLPTTTTITKLTNGTAYTFYIVARNATGLSIIATASEPVTPAAVPAAPKVTGVVGSQRVTLSWLPPLNNGSAITSYTVTSVPSSTVPANITSSPVLITGLTPNTGYVFSVVAVNGVGNSLAGTTASLRPTA